MDKPRLVPVHDLQEDAYLLAGHIDMKMTRRVYDRNIRMVAPLR
jgi:hypothetical protein